MFCWGGGGGLQGPRHHWEWLEVQRMARQSKINQQMNASLFPPANVTVRGRFAAPFRWLKKNILHVHRSVFGPSWKCVSGGGVEGGYSRQTSWLASLHTLCVGFFAPQQPPPPQSLLKPPAVKSLREAPPPPNKSPPNYSLICPTQRKIH